MRNVITIYESIKLLLSSQNILTSATKNLDLKKIYYKFYLIFYFWSDSYLQVKSLIKNSTCEDKL